ncbi:MFS transporter [Bradyrhizobium sp. Pear76]|uniref:MFS transporter n=1 Tax=Bradyrhizobium oropedii TaxID=1571201 RepID=UPI001E2FAE87|nr:MFS transporter [Bradyrhizobium oropedii]MCC8961932.1 MFS transporter [Bradyrhizobium oropedii]
MEQQQVRAGWRSLLKREWIPTLAILLGGVLLQSMNVLMLTTVLPSIVGELGGVAMLSWPTTAYLASSIVAASCVGVLSTALGARQVYCVGVAIFGVGAVLCSLAPAMGWIVAGRLIQGFGGGLEAAVAYVLVRGTFPEHMWSRTIALMSTSWSMSVLIGPLVGGMFAHFASWRGAFVASAATAVVLAIAAFFVLPPVSAAQRTSSARVPLGRVALICLAIAATSATSAAGSSLLKLGLIVMAIVSFVAMLRLDRLASPRLLPSDAFSWRTGTGVGLWLALLLCITFSPLQIYVPMFLQQLHGFDPLSAGFTVACASLGWSAASLLTAGVSARRADRLMLTGPAIMAAGLAAIGWLGPDGAASIILMVMAIAMLGAGIGQCWPLVAHRIMDSAKAGDEVVAASSVPTIQQMGFAFGAAIAGLIANASGLSAAIADATMARAAFWVPASFVVPAMLAVAAGLRLRALRKPQAGPP